MQNEKSTAAKQIITVIDSHEETVESLSGDEYVITISSPTNARVMVLQCPPPSKADDFTMMGWKFINDLKALMRNRITDLEEMFKTL